MSFKSTFFGLLFYGKKDHSIIERKYRREFQMPVT